MTASDLVLVTFQYKVIALRKSDGSKVWETELIKRFFKPADAFVALAIDENAVYAHAINEMFCLDLMTGRILWQQQLGSRGIFVGAGIPSIATTASNSSALSAQAAQFKALQRSKNDGGGT